MTFETTEQRIPANAGLRKCLDFMLDHYHENLDLERLAGVAGISRFDLCRVFKRHYKLSPMRFLWTFRTILAAEFIRMHPECRLTEIAFACGFNSSAHFSRTFRKNYGTSPFEYKNRCPAPGSHPTGSLTLTGQRPAGTTCYHLDSFYTPNPQITLHAMQQTKSSS